MAHHFANDIPPHLPMWQRVRAYAVPPSMIETASARRVLGDWAGACAAARVDVALDLRAVRNRHGTDLATRLRSDLRRLAPDLLRWHMPRIAPHGRLRPGLTIALATYRSSGAAPLRLVVRTPPPRADAGQRMSLDLWEGSAAGPHRYHPHPHPDRRFRLDLHRHLWDAGRSGELARRCGRGGVPSSLPRLPPGTAEADLPDLAVPPGQAGSWNRPGPQDVPGPQVRPENPAERHLPWAPANWAAEAELLLRAEGRSRGAFTVRLGARRRAVFELVAPDDSHAPTLRSPREDPPAQEAAALPVLPEASARLLPDLLLLRAGLVTPGELHPLVTAALAVSDAVPSAGSAASHGPVRDLGDPHRVECRGEVHRLALRDGVLTAVDHDPDQLRREELLVALGGPGLPCLRAIDAVHRSPEALPAVRERLGHGDVAGALAAVEGLLGPGAVLREGPLRDELAAAAARRVDDGLYRAGLVAVPGDAGTARSGPASRAGRGAGGRGPRLDRRTPPAVRRKRNSRARPRTGLI
ncbi:hypothetical protein ACL02U_25065 [Streptomyces sp. MS06]|uniref:hypothetical protein n=1 Tax=Streptomyces sp. MS06 TaxID=3385974 RepID=UPI0039A3E0A6